MMGQTTRFFYNLLILDCLVALIRVFISIIKMVKKRIYAQARGVFALGIKRFNIYAERVNRSRRKLADGGESLSGFS